MGLCAGVFVLMCKDVTGVYEQADEWKIQKTGMCFGCCRKAEMYCTLWQSHEQTVITTKAQTTTTMVSIVRQM